MNTAVNQTQSIKLLEPQDTGKITQRNKAKYKKER